MGESPFEAQQGDRQPLLAGCKTERRSELYGMNRAQLTFYFAFSLSLGLSIGVVGMLLWIKRVWSRIRNSAERQGPVNVDGIAVMSLFYVSPGLLFFLACSVPAIYFGHLLKQQSYCVEVVQTNRGVTRDDAFLKERCGYYDMNELFAKARGGP
jgi:hypothetical protein